MLSNVCKLWTAVYPPRMAPIWLKLGQNTFQTIPDVSYFDIEKLFTLRESRRGRLEARGRETGTSVSRKHATLEFRKPGTLERRGVKWQWNGSEWNGMGRHAMEWNGMEWNGMVWSEMEWNGMEWNGVHGMEWNEIVCSNFMLDPPK